MNYETKTATFASDLQFSKVSISDNNLSYSNASFSDLQESSNVVVYTTDNPASSDTITVSRVEIGG